MIIRKLLNFICFFGFCLFVSACASTKIVKMEKSGNFQMETDEARMWKRADELQEILNDSGYIYQDEALRKYVNSILHKLVGEYEKNNNVKLDIHIIKDPYFNAFCLPDGVIYLHTGILANAENEAQLATVLAHEASHFLNRHSLIQARSTINKAAFLSTWQVTFGSLSGVSGDAANLTRLLGEYCVIGSFYGYSRDLEREADKNGFELVKNAGYSYYEAKRFMENLYDATKDEKKKIPYFYSTHPETKERIKNYEMFIKNLSKDKDEKEGREVTHEDITYNKMIKNILLDNAELDLKRNNLKLAKKQIERFNKFYPNNPRGHCLLGEAYALENKKDEAERELLDAIRFDPTYAESHKSLGMLYYKKGDKKKAKIEFEEYLRLKPDVMDAEYVKGYINE